MAKKINPKKRTTSTTQQRANLRGGLSSILTAAAEAGKREETIKGLANTVMMVPIQKIKTNKYQPRQDFDEKALQELAASISEFGIIQPITVRYSESQEQFELISGERRWRASKIAGLEEIPAYIRIANDQELMEMALIENLQREDLNVIEEATTYSRLKREFELTDDQIAQRLGRGRPTVTNLLRLLLLPDTIQNALKKNLITQGHARPLLGLERVDQQLTAFAEIVKKKLSVRATEALVRAYKAGNKSTKTKPTGKTLPPEYEDIQQEFRTRLGSGSVRLEVSGKGKGKVVIPFNSVDQLQDFLDRLED